MRKHTKLVKKYLAVWLRQVRADMGLSQEEMSEELRITPRAYSDLEREVKGLSAATLLIFLAGLPAEKVLRLTGEFREEVRKAEEQEEEP